MNPHQKNKVDVKNLSPEEQRLFRLYGKLPSRSDHFAKHLKDRKYFDSGDYAMSKAGKGDGLNDGAVGSEHPVPENIPHLSSPINNVTSTSPTNNAGQPASGSLPKHAHHGSVPGIQAGSPIKEGSFLQRETSIDDVDKEQKTGAETSESLAASDPIPIRR
ncbi:camp-regulated phosphoprotein/endosulfine conserved region-domain-containing protein [Emericellopsis atlantica]|uniref:mRNA stability protein n=1 Tax=Emericellopsis atlantica TaxID=2614577 RepID=A0A9P7ZI92_9HYPO|nr:camp-regulated phosphoprotein/endosulfine conserved region-domain-containing protein [Emericellopsis atlantica]KAG9252065.1 camp-regulated phosphoprotein/endosulfine conserved region-domain-containing protein [Emericellopsis atlantica]